MKIIKFLLILLIILMSTKSFAYNPNSFYDEEELRINGHRPKIDIVLSELEVIVEPENFINGIAEKTITITNDGNVPCRLTLELKDVPIDLAVNATVDDDFLIKGESTNLNISIELSDMQETEAFNFIIVVKARL